MTEKGPSLRLFIAATLPDEWLTGLRALQDELRRALEPGIRLRYVRPEGIHLTLKFLGATDPSLLETPHRALPGAVPHPLAFPLRPGGAGTFGDRRSVRVAWFGLEGETEKLSAVASRIDAAVHGLG